MPLKPKRKGSDLSAYPSSPQCGRRELVVSRRSGNELRRRSLLGIHTQGDVAACQQVVQGLQRVTRDLLLVVEGQMAFAHTPQGATAVVVVGQGDHPGVLVHEEITLGVEIGRASCRERVWSRVVAGSV